jgi:methenyltetrahydrofolate cyclohydrolase
VRDQSIGRFLDDVAARVPAPGGGAVAALQAAQAAALLAMVARYSDGPRYAADAETIGSVLTAAEDLRAECLRLAEEDAAAFGAVGAAYALPRDSERALAIRSGAIAAALAGAAEPPARVVAASGRLVGLAETLLPRGNRNVITDIAAAAESARGAAATARVNVEVNLSGIPDDSVREQFRAAIAGTDAVLARAAAVTDAVRAELAR